MSNRPTIGQTAHNDRESQTRKKVWNPPNRLGTPTPPEGYKYRFVRRSLRGVEETGNVLSRIAQHYEVVKPDELQGENPYQTLDSGKHAGAVVSGDLMLMKVPEEIVEQRESHFNAQAQRMQEAVDSDLMRENTRSMPITKNRKTHIEVGTRRNTIAGDDES